MRWWDQYLNRKEEGNGASKEAEKEVKWHREKCRLKYFLGGISLTTCMKGGYIIHTPLYTNLQVEEGELNNLSHILLLVHYYLVLAQFQIKRAHFSLVFPTCVQFCTQNVVPFFMTYSAAIFLWPWKVVPHYYQHLDRLYPSPQRATDLNNQKRRQ